MKKLLIIAPGFILLVLSLIFVDASLKMLWEAIIEVPFDISFVGFLFASVVGNAFFAMGVITFWSEKMTFLSMKPSLDKASQLVKDNQAIVDEAEKNRAGWLEINSMLSELLDKTSSKAKAKALTEENQHIDDWALDQFFLQVRAKVKQKREEGYAGWNGCQQELLNDAFVEQVESLNVETIDMVDAAAYAAFIWNRQAFPIDDPAFESFLQPELADTEAK